MKRELVSPDISIMEISTLLKPHRESGKKLVTTNGCFDLLHTGHVKYLYDAAQLADILVVGINSDSSVSRLKGNSRPVQKERDRVTLIGALKVVDYAFIFSEPDPCTFLEILRPDIHVKGGDYSPEELPETEVVRRHGGDVVIVAFEQGYSTTGLIDTIQKL